MSLFKKNKQAGQKKSAAVYKRLLSFAKKYWPIFLLGILGTAALSLIDAGFTWLIKPIINKGFIARDEVFIKWLPLLIIIIFMLRAVANFVSSYFILRVARNVVMDFRYLLFQRYLKLPNVFFDQNSSGHLLSTIIYNVEQVADATSNALLVLLREGTFAIGLIVVMIAASWRLTLLFLIIAPPLAFVLRWSSKRLRRLSGTVQDAMGDVTQVASEGINNYKVIRLFNGEQYEDKKFNTAVKNNRHRELKIAVTNSVGSSSVQLLMAVPIVIALFFATSKSFGVSAGSFAAIVAAMLSLLRPVRRLSMVNNQIQKGIAAAISIFTVLDKPVETDHGTKKLLRAKGDIDFQKVAFNYPGSHNFTLTDINLNIKAGQTIAIVGHSGSGKSTLINLLPRFYPLTGGRILIDGVDINDYKLTELRAQFALVEQNTTLFNDTIANNIAYASRHKPSITAIRKAAQSAYALEFIEQLPNGFDSLIGEDGVLLSGGQRQRIAIARALLKDAPILILDEATSALDSHAEQQIQQALNGLMQNRTTLVIAHRLSTIEHANWVVVMAKGQMVEQGTHRQLLAQNGHYAKLYRLHYQQQNNADQKLAIDD